MPQIKRLGPNDPDPTDHSHVLIKYQHMKTHSGYAVTWSMHNSQGVLFGHYPNHLDNEARAIEVAHTVAIERNLDLIYISGH